MANPPPDLNSILQMLGAQAAGRPATSTPTQNQPGLPAPAPPMAHNPYAPPPQQNPYPPAQPYAQQAPPSYSYPQPSQTGSIDLSAIRPVNSGTVPLADAIAKAKAYATEKGFTPYDRPAGGYPAQDPRPPAGYPSHDSRPADNRQYPRGRSKSPRRDNFRENMNPYRDERRGDHGGQPREYGRDRSFSPGRGRQGFSPRGASGGARDRSPLRGKDDNSETIEIEGSLVGLIIGRQGENLRRVESESRCRVQFVPATGNETMRLCRITGPRPQREQAKEMINAIINDSGMRGGGRGGGGGGPQDGGYGGGGGGYGREPRGPPPAAPTVVPKEGEDSVQIMVPDRTVGLIIGRGGETIRDLQERSGCHINIVGQKESVNGLRPVNLIGTPQASRHAKELILEIVDSDSRNGGAQGGGSQQGGRPAGRDNFMGGGGGGGPDKITDSIYVPSDSVGMIIGKGGETIREMQTMTGCKINVSQPSGPGETEREIGLVGSRDAIAQAKQAIEEKVDAARSKGGPGGGGRGRPPPRDYDNAGYGGQSSNHNSAPASQPQSNPAPAAGPAGQPDPYAMYGGYENYIALWWQSQMAGQSQGQGAAGPPGTS
ncbi:hypothetical protein B0T18DRAFT_392933 [Schizothecium vesticola]|uniref:K Homology domain-containing protein n=1 Tax=Schizothecium vesticola TaxID=314040 RepID=A0AA40BTD9_9PEZI|nr:hypothetical protein B0T18DRAFT_392933 [Schizothecium vesticola]